MTTIDYSYDGLSRLLSANYSVGADYTYGYDVAGNLTNNNGTTRTFNAANQMVNDGTNTLTYDNNGNLTSDGVHTLTWDRANRLLEYRLDSLHFNKYRYDGDGNRIQQTARSIDTLVSTYLLDIQPGLAVVLREAVTTDIPGSVAYHYATHGPRGIHKYDAHWIAQDGLGSVRGLYDAEVVQ